MFGSRIELPREFGSSSILVPVEIQVLVPLSWASVAEFRLSANSVGRFSVSSLEIESAGLFQMPGQCTTVMLN